MEGNYIGTNTIGGTVAGSANVGVDIASGASGNTIGGTASGAGNVIARNIVGVDLHETGTTGNVVQGNFIGTNAAGATGLGNANVGVDIASGASGNTIGGTASGAGNVIARNGGAGPNGAGVNVGNNPTDTSINNAILANSIVSNAGLGIDLGNDGVTLDTSGGPHAGPNHLQNFPVLTSAVVVGGTTTIAGTLNSTPNATFTVQFFANAASDPSGFGEGQQYLGQTGVTTDGSGNASFSVPLFNPTSGGPILHHDGDRPGWQYVGVLPGHLERHHGHEHQRQRPRLAAAGDPQRQR